jgi:hypothetical protein
LVNPRTKPNKRMTLGLNQSRMRRRLAGTREQSENETAPKSSDAANSGANMGRISSGKGLAERDMQPPEIASGKHSRVP